MYFETDAIVLRANKSINNDIFLTLFTKKAGKMEVVSNGAKSSKSPLAACSKPFVFGRFILNTKTKTMKITSCDIHDSHFRIADDLNSLAFGNYFIELCNLTIYPNIADTEHFQLIVEIIHLLSLQDIDYNLLRAAYLIKLARITGHKPHFDNTCIHCGASTDQFYFSIHSGGMICSNCKGGTDPIKLNQQFISIMIYLMEKDVRVIVKTKIHPNYTIKIIEIFEKFLMVHQGITKIKSKDFLDIL